MVSLGTFVLSDRVSEGSGTAARSTVSAGARVVSVRVVSARSPVVSGLTAVESRRWAVVVSVRA